MSRPNSAGTAATFSGGCARGSSQLSFPLNRLFISHRIHGAAIYGNIYHQYTTPVMLANIPYMDPIHILFIGLMEMDIAPNCSHMMLQKKATEIQK